MDWKTGHTNAQVFFLIPILKIQYISSRKVVGKQVEGTGQGNQLSVYHIHTLYIAPLLFRNSGQPMFA